MDQHKEYVQSAAPDKMKLAELVIKAKGPDRTMAKFSEMCGINTSTLSRISKGKINNPLTVDVLKRIYNARCEEAGFSFGTLLLANGMMEQGAIDKGKEIVEKIFSARDRGVEAERHAKNAIVAALLERGMAVQSIPTSTENRRSEATGSISYRPDFGFYFENAQPQTWYFDVKIDGPGPVGSGRSFQRYGRYFLLDAWEPELLKNQKMSFVFLHRFTYEEFIRNYKGAPIKAATSAILIDEKNEKFIEETWISQTPETRSLLSLPIIQRQGLESSWVDEDEEIFDDFEE